MKVVVVVFCEITCSSYLKHSETHRGFRHCTTLTRFFSIHSKLRNQLHVAETLETCGT